MMLLTKANLAALPPIGSSSFVTRVVIGFSFG